MFSQIYTGLYGKGRTILGLSKMKIKIQKAYIMPFWSWRILEKRIERNPEPFLTILGIADVNQMKMGQINTYYMKKTGVIEEKIEKDTNGRLSALETKSSKDVRLGYVKTAYLRKTQIPEPIPTDKEDIAISHAEIAKILLYEFEISHDVRTSTLGRGSREVGGRVSYNDVSVNRLKQK